MGPQSLHDVSEISAILVRTPGNPGDLTSILQYIAQTAQDAFSSDACVILAFNPITGSFMGSQTAGNLQVENRLLHDKPRANGATQQVLKDGIFLIEDLEVKPQYHNRFTRKVGIRALAGLAMRSRHRQRPLGVIYLDFRQPKKFSSTDSESFRIFAIQASLLLQETWLAHNYEEVARIGQQVNQNLGEVSDLFRELQTYVASVLDESHTLLLAVSQPQTNTLNVYVKGQGFSSCVNTPIQGIYKHVIETQEPKFIQQLSREAEQLPSQIINITGTEEKESYIFVPLMLRGVSLGVLSIQHSLPEAYGQEDLFVLQLLANYIALALHNMRLYNILNQLNETGQILTQQLESEQTLQATVDKIREATQADVVVLYPYDPIAQHFAFPARIAGILLDSSIKPMFPSRPDDIASLTWSRKKPIFAKESAFLYTELQGDVPIRQGNFQERENIRSTAALPLQAGDEIVGILFVNFRQTQRFDAAQKLFIEGLAHYAAIAIKNAQVFGILSLRRVRELEILQNIDRELSRTLELETVLNTLLRLAHEHVPAEEASILLHSPRTQVLETVAAIGRHAEASLKQTISLHETKAITRWVLEEKKPARVNNVYDDLPWRDLHLPVAADTLSELDVPLLDGDEVVGVFNFESIREGAFHQEDQDFLLTLAGQAVLAIKNAQAYEREKRLAEEGRVLNEISKQITSQLDLTYVFDLILEKALALTHSTLGSLHLYDPDLHDLNMVVKHGVVEGKKGQRQRPDQGIVGYVAADKQLRNIGDVSQYPWNEIYREAFPKVRSELAVPMLAGNQLRGVLYVESPTPNNFNESDERLLQGLADMAVVALQNAERYEQAKREAQRFELLYQAGQELGKITNLEQLEQAYEVVVQIAEKQSQSQAVIYLYDEMNEEVVLKCASPYREALLFDRIKLDEGLNGQVARERRTIIIHDSNNLPPNVVSIKQSDSRMHSLVVTPIMFEERYYGNLGLRHEAIGHFQGADILFFEGLAQQLASTVHRLETAQERQKFEQRALSAEEMSSIGQSAFEVTHRLGNDLGLVELYVTDIEAELEKQDVTNTFVSKKLENILQSVQAVLSFSGDLKQELAKLGAKEEMAGELVLIPPRVLFEEASVVPMLPANIQICVEIDEDVTAVRVFHSLVADILRNLVANAIQAMPEGGKLTLRAHNVGRSVALQVSDTGIGIPPQKLPNIFDLFFSTKGSSGFGLWSARRNALKNHGDLKVESKQGHGTTFTLLLPRTNRKDHEVLRKQ